MTGQLKFETDKFLKTVIVGHDFFLICKFEFFYSFLISIKFLRSFLFSFFG